MATRKPESNYRRRVLAVGGLAAFALFVVGAPIFNNRIEDDLERRVPASLNVAEGRVVASFSGQDGTLFCQRPLSDPEAALDAAYDVNGVRSITLDRSCRVSTATEPATGSGGVGGGDDGSIATPPDSSTASTGGSSSTTTGNEPPNDADTVFAALGADPQFSSLALLVSESEISNELGDGAAPAITIFAPTNDAFEAVSPDRLAALRSEPEVRDRVLRSHMVSGNLSLEDLVTGSLTALDGTQLDIVNEGGVVTVGGATVTDGPFTAANGAVYSVDRVLIPADVATPPPPQPALTTLEATFGNGTIELAGLVASEAERAQLVGTSVFGVGATNVIDALTIDATAGLSAAQVATLNELLIAMRVHLVTGSVGFDGTTFYANGAFASEEGRDAMAAAAAAVGATATLEPRPTGTDADAADLESSINEYVAANPILFEAESAVLDPTAPPILARIAATMLEVSGLSVAVEGHTDSDGSAATNLTLSEARAAAVAQVLVAAGVPAVTSTGFGSEQPVLVDGVEDKVASRRVEFRIGLA